MKRTLKLVSLMLCIMMTLSLSAPALAQEEHGPLWIEGGEGVTLTWFIPMNISTEYMESYNDHPFFKWMEEQTGVHVEFIHPSWEQLSTQFNLMISSDNYADMMYYVVYPEGPEASITDEIFADITQFEDIMPNYFKALRSNDGSFSAWEWGEEKELYQVAAQPAFEDLSLNPNGSMWCVTQIWTDTQPTPVGAVIRKDWLDEAGLAIPETIEELEVVLEAFKKRGEDVIPMSIINTGYQGASYYLASAFGIVPGWFSVQDGVVNDIAWTTEAGKEYLSLMHDWYQKGYIDPDFMNRDNDAINALFMSDRLGIITQTWSIGYKDNYVGEQNFEVAALPLVRHSKDQILPAKNYTSSQVSAYTCIAANSPNKEIAAQYLDRLYSKEAILRAWYGEEGLTYTLDENGVPYFTEYFYDNLYTGDALASTFLMPPMTGYYSVRSTLLRNLNTAQDRSVQAQKTTLNDYAKACVTWGANATTDIVLGYVTFEGNGWSEMYTPYTEADTYASAQILKYITGKEDLSTFEEFAKKALDMGYSQAREKMQEAYNRQYRQDASFGLKGE